jgi:hypothetical protein
MAVHVVRRTALVLLVGLASWSGSIHADEPVPQLPPLVPVATPTPAPPSVVAPAQAYIPTQPAPDPTPRVVGDPIPRIAVEGTPTDAGSKDGSYAGGKCGGYSGGKDGSNKDGVRRPQLCERWFNRSRIFGCWADYNTDYNCGSCRSEYLFIFGSCRQFWREPCLKEPPTNPLGVPRVDAHCGCNKP